MWILYARTAPNAALISLAGDLPVPILADVLGLHTATAEQWAHLANRDWAAYIAERVIVGRSHDASTID
jgi:hypothetical protein